MIFMALIKSTTPKQEQSKMKTHWPIHLATAKEARSVQRAIYNRVVRSNSSPDREQLLKEIKKRIQTIEEVLKNQDEL